MILPIIYAVILYCFSQIPKDMRSETYYDPYSCNNCLDINEDIQFHLYTKNNSDQPHILRPDDDSTLLESPFNPEHKTVIIIHGFTANAETESSQSIKNALLQIGECNAILVDWGSLSRGPDYCKVTSRMPVTGTYVAQMIKSLEKTFSISRTTFHVIGFSLGAHISGLTGEALARNDPNKIKIGRITGLDPAGPAFEASNGLDKTDATFVDIIHTNTIKYGILKPIGHVDFYVNYGYRQPGCYPHQIGCSHQRAWEIFAESILTPYEFPAFKCKNPGTWLKAKLLLGRLSNPQSNCEKFEDVYMGFIANPTFVGEFTVFTNNRPPYGNSGGVTSADDIDEADETTVEDPNIVHENDEIDTFNEEENFVDIDEGISNDNIVEQTINVI